MGAAGESGATRPIGPTGDGVIVVNQITGGTHNVTYAILDAAALAGEEMTFGGACRPRPR